MYIDHIIFLHYFQKNCKEKQFLIPIALHYIWNLLRRHKCQIDAYRAEKTHASRSYLKIFKKWWSTTCVWIAWHKHFLIQFIRFISLIVIPLYRWVQSHRIRFWFQVGYGDRTFNTSLLFVPKAFNEPGYGDRLGYDEQQGYGVLNPTVYNILFW